MFANGSTFSNNIQYKIPVGSAKAYPLGLFDSEKQCFFSLIRAKKRGANAI